ncbi:MULTISPECIES: DUF3291 domain-containing protein [unclassified Rhizobium]|uniref:DUF3291 domain-containing protein n=1 Tax=unclassified Rhizobium TaxID=2613769 RepID=UPI001C831F97|nr:MULTISPECIES: DUF3291 domain-containing protein [unclassified Rhizobium]MBX5161747.1 DUF3291 domain-containing protein [Rhizobium sp. NZLR8]MBX5168002.1 DUF3291 domain-containing protein [Rhizobium sp. NZLR4b]MBX5212176.1 DUF3291 domain-containing protein [Rhizobium sp. NZLR11]
MQSARLALYNFGLHIAPAESETVEGFVLREPLNFEAAGRACGFIGRSGYPGYPGARSWGVQVFPRYIEGSGFTSAPSSLSLWADIECLMAFTYNGVHAEALKHARNWNVTQTWPPLVLWWVSGHHRPDWQEGVEHLEYLADHGQSPRAFTFKQAYGPGGAETTIDRDRVRELAARNAETQKDLLACVRTLKV